MKTVSLTAITVSIAFSIIFCPSGGVGNTSESGVAVQSGEAVIWYLGHCGYAVKTENHLLIFDYIELEESPQERGMDLGFIDPEEIKDLNVSVFVTHEHVDHYDQIIYTWDGVIENIEYFFGWQAGDNPNYHYLVGPRAEIETNGMEIFTVNSHHSGVPEVAYLVKVDGLVIFHEGDYQGRMGRNAPSRVVEDMDYLLTKVDRVDLMFIGAWLGDPIVEMLERLNPKIAFPMHDRKQEHKYLEFAKEAKAKGIAAEIVCPTKRGDNFRFSGGKIE